MAEAEYKDPKMAKKAKAYLVVTLFFALSTCIWGTIRVVKAIQFEIDCASYLNRAAIANTTDLAQTELKKAIDYAEENDLTSGVVSVFLKNPSNDLGFWYENMTAAYDELDSIPTEATQLERTNILMKLRESLTGDSETGTTVNVPDGISVYPNNVPLFWWGAISITGVTIFLIMWAVAYEKATGSTKLRMTTVSLSKK